MTIAKLVSIIRINGYIGLLLFLTECNRASRDENASIRNNEVIELEPAEFKSQLSSTADAILIDVRKPAELAEGIIAGATNLDYTDSTFTEKIKGLDKSKSYFVYCKSGVRSGKAGGEMQKLGFENIYILKGGYLNWVQQDFETIKP